MEKTVASENDGRWSGVVGPDQSGGGSFVFTWREGGWNSIPNSITPGRYPDISLKQAQQIRDRYRAQLADNGTIKLGNETIIPDEQAMVDAEINSCEEVVTVRDALEYWFTGYAKSHCKGWLRDKERIEKYVYRTIGCRGVNECTVREWVACFEKIRVKYPVSAGSAFQVCRQALRYCRLRGFHKQPGTDRHLYSKRSC